MEKSFKIDFDRLEARIRAAIRGNDKNVRFALICFFAEGHLLIEGVPGVAKTSLAKAIAQSIKDIRPARIQFTPDLLPSDVTGSRVYRQGGVLEFEHGPVFNHIVIGDEINRASPKTQSALLEAMAERQVTTDGETRPLERPFMCVATQNPVEHQGTYVLPEAQIDRFMMMLSMEYPTVDDEVQVVTDELVDAEPSATESSAEPEPVVDLARALRMIGQARKVYVAPLLKKYAVEVVHATRNPRAGVWLGASPRGSIALVAAARTHAAAMGRDYTVTQDVKQVAPAVLAHRVLMDPDLTDKTSDALVRDILASTNLPGPSDVDCKKPEGPQ
ncbi:ATPase associated with various cellular activities AAA_3 [Catenulispora acidiphila DSM 44928]|uniref:ATPase associated with various cellular activities AAA_3 n=1 Tax=Catenulispora acidiphila (strain DSM 44928 / JCM 14897 / NBRC 102108 / NRRL B-24433 / ID139908) TaxID=479433 RepID=C7QDE1_CATAD|nr:AAA family ATPase [Catenulispora acidiphila]ACU72734.1 ATPase associated with various cellular activities AAA_3 [Catenulispora acidiphila DSM 44928]